MARTIWKGALSFGLVNVPVGIYPATQDKSIHFNQLEEGTSDRIRYKKVNERTGKEVDNDQIVKGYDVGGGHYVILTDEELESAEPERLGSSTSPTSSTRTTSIRSTTAPPTTSHLRAKRARRPTRCFARRCATRRRSPSGRS